MAYEFNAYAPLSTTPTLIRFAAGPDMLEDYPNAEIRIVGLGLSFDAGTGTLTGTITEIQLYDPDFDNGVTIGNPRQTIAIEAGSDPGQQSGLAGAITAFLQGGLGIVADTFTAWDLVGDGFDHFGNATFDPSGTFAILELRDNTNTTFGHLRIEGSNLADNTLSLTGTINKIINLDSNEDPIPGEVADYTSSPKPFAMFENGLLSLALPDPDGGLIGNDEVFYQVLVAGDNTVTNHDDVFDDGYGESDGGLGDDVFVNEFPGGFIQHATATSGVAASLATGTSTGGAGSNSWNPNEIGGLGGSNFDDTLSGSAAKSSVIYGRSGNDNLTGSSSHDYLDGGVGNDTISGGDGDDAIFAGAGNDEIHGGANAGDNFGDGPGDGHDDVLFYSHIGFPPSFANAAGDMGSDAAEFSAGITVAFSGTGAGTATGADVGTDTFDGIERVWGTRNADTFDFSAAGAGSVNRATGMDGSDTFLGGAGRDVVSFDDELFDIGLLPMAIEGTLTNGVTVNLSGVTTFGIASGTAIDMFGNTDTLTNIDDIIASINDDLIAGSSTANTIITHEGDDSVDGGGGNDVIEGRRGLDTLMGGAGADTITGGEGRDMMTGGSEADIFDFNAVNESGRTAGTRDRITDFRHLVDDIDLSTIDASTRKAGNQTFKFIGTNGFHKVAGELHYIKAAGKVIVEGDTNGDGRADFQIELLGVKTLSAGDFIL